MELPSACFIGKTVSTLITLVVHNIWRKWNSQVADKYIKVI